MAKCSVCGREMTARKDEYGKEYAVQICGEECMGVAWSIVTSALKLGIRPNWHKEASGKKFRLTEAERVEILELAERGYNTRQISIALGRSYMAIKSVIDSL